MKAKDAKVDFLPGDLVAESQEAVRMGPVCFRSADCETVLTKEHLQRSEVLIVLSSMEMFPKIRPSTSPDLRQDARILVLTRKGVRAIKKLYIEKIDK